MEIDENIKQILDSGIKFFPRLVRRSGSSLCVSVDKEVVESLNLKQGEKIMVGVAKIKEEKTKEFKCGVCGLIFMFEDEDYLECPCCGETYNIRGVMENE